MDHNLSDSGIITLLQMKLDSLNSDNMLKLRKRARDGQKELALYNLLTKDIVAHGSFKKVIESFNYGTIKYHLMGKNNLHNKTTTWDEKGRQIWTDVTETELTFHEHKINKEALRITKNIMLNLLLKLFDKFDEIYDFTMHRVKECYLEEYENFLYDDSKDFYNSLIRCIEEFILNIVLTHFNYQT